MAVDYAEKEREFLESLSADTGRDLAGWMAAIAATGLDDRNAVIDWLRQQGFLFARASWLERIHHNGGRPIYLDPTLFIAGFSAGAHPIAPRPGPAPAPALPPAVAPLQPPAPPPAPVVPRPAVPAPSQLPRASLPAARAVSLDSVLAEAKGYRPLAQLVLREIQKAVPQTVLEPREGYIALLSQEGALFGILTITARELRLALAFGDRPAPPPFTKARFSKSAPEIPSAISYMVILEDARQVTPELVAVVAETLAAA